VLYTSIQQDVDPEDVKKGIDASEPNKKARRRWRKKLEERDRGGSVKQECGEEKVRKEKEKVTDGKEAE
jgi:hypothetical protein